MTAKTTPKPDFEGFAKAILEQWPTSDIDGADLFKLSVSYGMISEVPGGYDPEHHIDAEGICPERGDPWYEYTFRGEAGPGLYSRQHLTARIAELEAEVAALRAALEPAPVTVGEIDILRMIIAKLEQCESDVAPWALKWCDKLASALLEGATLEIVIEDLRALADAQEAVGE